jgi:transcriptional regulator with XRE-family HTH domain
VDQHHPTPQHYIREWRRHRGLTQAQLAEAVCIDRSQLNKIERGRRPCSRPVLEAVAAKLECEPNDLIRRHPSHSSEFETVYKSLSPEDRPRAISLLKAVFALNNCPRLPVGAAATPPGAIMAAADTGRNGAGLSPRGPGSD